MKNNHYAVFALIFLFLSLAGGIYLTKQYQKSRDFTADNSVSVKPTPQETDINPTEIPILTETLTPTLANTSVPVEDLTIVSTPEYDGPSPTRILLPLAGIEFPSLALTLLGGIIILLGFLVLM